MNNSMYRLSYRKQEVLIMKPVKLKIDGMTCSSCERKVIQAFNKIGATNVTANYQTGMTMLDIPVDIFKVDIKTVIHDLNYNLVKIEINGDDHPVEENKYYDFDLLIVGSGSAAFAAAIKAVEYGANVGMIEKGIIGGTCVNIGCVPSKTLLRAGEMNEFAQTNPFEGLNTSTQPVNLDKLMDQKDKLVDDLRNKKYVDLIKAYGINLIKGSATFINEGTLDVGGKQYTAKRFLLATGSSPHIPSIDGLNDTDYLTSTSLLELADIPKRLTVIGSGYIAMELGQLFHNLGSKVTLLERSKRLLKDYDEEISLAIEKAMSIQGITFIKGVQYELVAQNGKEKHVFYSLKGKKQVIKSDELLIATGRVPNTKTLNLKRAKVETGAHQEIIINNKAQTSNKRIYAAGDVTNGPQFVYVAAYEGGIVADNAIGGLNKELDLTVVPSVIFTHPSVASVGLTENQAIKQGYKVKSSVLNLDAVPRAIVNYETNGVIKMVVDEKTNKILGVHMVSEHAGEVIYAATLAINFGMTVKDITDSMVPYLTMSEALKLVALTFNRDVSKLSCCAA